MGLAGGGLWMLQGVGVTAFSSADAEEVVAEALSLDPVPRWLGPRSLTMVPDGSWEEHVFRSWRGVCTRSIRLVPQNAGTEALRRRADRAEMERRMDPRRPSATPLRRGVADGRLAY